jgi:hypothetical protein
MAGPVLAIGSCGTGDSAPGAPASAVDAAMPEPGAGDPAVTSPAPSPTGTPGSGGPTTEPEPSCVRDLAFWRAAPVWPAESLDIGGYVYSDTQMRELVALDRESDASIELAQDFIATHMNECDGCGVPDDVRELMHQTHLWMRTHADADGAAPFGTAEGPSADEARRIAAALRVWLAS